MPRPSRLLLLVPLALLSAALLVRARLPRPQTEGDKWLWEQAETTSGIMLLPASPSIMPQQRAKPQSSARNSPAGYLLVLVDDRVDIRALLRALQGTPRFRFAALPGEVDKTRLVVKMGLLHKGDQGCFDRVGESCSLWLYKGKQHFYLYRSNGSYAAVETASVERFISVLRAAILKVNRRQSGYKATKW